MPPNTRKGRTVSGYVEDLWKNHGPTGKILNALDLPMFDVDTSVAEHTTDLHAWSVMRGMHHVHAKEQYPAEDMRWALVGLKNTMTYVHVDCDGLGTDNHILCGGKVWGFLYDYPECPVPSVNFFLNNDFRLDEVTPDASYKFEAVYLKPGDRLYVLF